MYISSPLAIKTLLFIPLSNSTYPRGFLGANCGDLSLPKFFIFLNSIKTLELFDATAENPVLTVLFKPRKMLILVTLFLILFRPGNFILILLKSDTDSSASVGASLCTPS